MSEDHKPDSLRDLDERLKRLRGEGALRGKASGGGGDPRSGLGFAFRIGVELVAALFVGVGIGLLLDRWLGTSPWLMIVFIVLGAAAGLLNVYRVMARMNRVVGFDRKTKEKEAKPPDG